jgi:hypothetical protein
MKEPENLSTICKVIDRPDYGNSLAVNDTKNTLNDFVALRLHSLRKTDLLKQ